MTRYAIVTIACAASTLFACGGSSEPPQAPTSAEEPKGAPTPAVEPTPANTSTSATPAPSSGAKEGETCGDGVLGRPNIACATGLVCDLKGPPSAAPPGAQGSALPGKCKKP